MIGSHASTPARPTDHYKYYLRKFWVALHIDERWPTELFSFFFFFTTERSLIDSNWSKIKVSIKTKWKTIKWRSNKWKLNTRALLHAHVWVVWVHLLCYTWCTRRDGVGLSQVRRSAWVTGIELGRARGDESSKTIGLGQVTCVSIESRCVAPTVAWHMAVVARLHNKFFKIPLVLRFFLIYLYFHNFS